MSTRSLNKVMLIGNLTRDPELRYTPQGTAVCTMGLATNRSWTTDSGEKREETEFHRIVAWNKLAELCSQLLFKGRRIYVEGRLSTRSWTGTDGAQRQATEIVIDDMVILDSKRQDDGYQAGESPAFEQASETSVASYPGRPEAPAVESPSTDPAVAPVAETVSETSVKPKAPKKKIESAPKSDGDTAVDPEDIPF